MIDLLLFIAGGLMFFLRSSIFVLFFIFSITHASLLKPYNGQYISYVYVLFEWDQEPDAIMYNIQLSTSSSFTNNLLDINTSQLIYIYKDDIDWSDNYYWRVRPLYDCDGCDYIYGEWINTNTFSITNRITGSNGTSIKSNPPASKHSCLFSCLEEINTAFRFNT